MEAKDISRMLSPSELAELTGINIATLANWRCRGGGPPFTRLGRAIRYPLAEVQQWLAENTGRSTTELDQRGGES